MVLEEAQRKQLVSGLIYVIPPSHTREHNRLTHRFTGLRTPTSAPKEMNGEGQRLDVQMEPAICNPGALPTRHPQMH